MILEFLKCLGTGILFVIICVGMAITFIQFKEIVAILLCILMIAAIGWAIRK